MKKTRYALIAGTLLFWLCAFCAVSAAEEIIVGDEDAPDLVFEPETETERVIDFAALKEKNEDVYSWIYLPGTGIDYPILQSPDTEDQEYYLNNNMDRQEDIYGEIFTQCYNKKDYTDFLTVIYGHNMRDETMFGSLKMYEDNPDMLWAHKDVYIYLPEITLSYEIFAAYPIDAVHLLYQFDQNDPKMRREYLKKIKKQGEKVASFDDDLFDTLDEDSHIIALYTCYRGDPEYRFVVLAALNEDRWDWEEKAEELGIRETEPETESETETETKVETETDKL